jgi:hypothetical protein
MLILTYLLNIIDYLFTLYWVRKFGIEIEGNPIGRWMFSHNIAWLFKIVLNGVLLGAVGWYIHRHPEDGYLAWICLIVYGLLCLYHIGLYLYLRR